MQPEPPAGPAPRASVAGDDAVIHESRKRRMLDDDDTEFPRMRGQQRGGQAVLCGASGMEALRHVAGFEERVQPGGLRAGQAQRPLHAIGIKPQRRGGRGGGAKRPVRRGRMPEPVMRGHHRHADPHRDLVPRDDGQHDLLPAQPMRLAHRQGDRHDNRADMQQRRLVGVVIVGGVDQDAVAQRGEGRLRRASWGADDPRARADCGIQGRDVAGDRGSAALHARDAALR